MNINFNLNFDRLVKFNEAFWKKLGSAVITWIRTDAGQGVFQTDEPHKKTYNTDYARLKERRFKAVTKRRYKNVDGGMEYAGQGVERVRIKDGRKGQRLGQYQGVSIVSTNTSFVDMTVSGQTLRGLHIADSTPKSVTLSYQPRDLWKIVGNQRPGLNRRLVGLRAKNFNKLKDMFMQDISNKIIKDIVGRTTINIKI